MGLLFSNCIEWGMRDIGLGGFGLDGLTGAKVA